MSMSTEIHSRLTEAVTYVLIASMGKLSCPNFMKMISAKGSFIYTHNPSKQAAEREQLEQNLDRMKMYLDKHIGEALAIPKSYKKYFNVHLNKKGELTSYDENTAYIESKLETCGYFCIITSEEMSAKGGLDSLQRSRCV